MRSFLRYFLLLIATLAALTLYLPVHYGVDYPAQLGPKFDADIDMTYRDEITAERPQIVLLGNSMVEANVDPPALAEALGRTVYIVSYSNTASSMWYLFIKNNIVTSPYKPPILVIVFHDTTLTSPRYKVDGRLTALDKLAGTNEEVLTQLAYTNHMNPLEKFTKRYFPLIEFGSQIRDRIDSFIRYYSHRPFFNCGKRCVDSAFTNTFNLRAMNLPDANDLTSEESALYTNAYMNFSNRIDESFLPEIIRLCKENSIALILVRSKTNSFPGGVEPVGISNYMDSLGDYLAKNNVQFADFHSDPRLSSKDFMDWFHVFPEARGTYTQILAEALKPLLEPGR